MKHHQDILHELDDFCARTGLTRTAVCRRAVDNSRLADRLPRRLALLERDISKLRAFMASYAEPPGDA